MISGGDSEVEQVAKKARESDSALVIVESPTKAKTINRYLGSGYAVMASMGHVRDLPENDLGVDLDRGFDPVYEVLPARRKVVKDLKKAADKADTVFLATDLDREGEAIAWHLVHALDLDEKRTRRVVFNEITKSAIQQAFAHPQELDMDKVNAQQARRILDRIVGYQLSPLLQAKIARGLSAGRVQSVAVRLIVEREREIRAFIPKESWRVAAYLAVDTAAVPSLAKALHQFLNSAKDAEAGRTLRERNAWLSKHNCLYAELIKLDGKEFHAAKVSEARAVVEALGFVVDGVDEKEWEAYRDRGLKLVGLRGHTDAARAPIYTVQDVRRRRTTSKPSPPFTTAALQQAASSALGFAPARTMRVAQQLYEGVDLEGDGGLVGLITYMRTDSTNLSKESVGTAREWIRNQHGPNYLPAQPNVFGKTRRAQEAHEAIRPSDVMRTPESVRSHLTAEQTKLYDLIWRRFVACQMVPAQWDSTQILINAKSAAGEALFRASGRSLVFDGFLRIWGASDTEEIVLPDIETGRRLGLLHLHPQQQYTSPPSRYNEATLVKKLEAEGIGRPSTYAAIIQTVQDRAYVELIDKRLHPTIRGEIVTDKLMEHFPRIMDVKFTSFMEDELDKIEEAHLDWVHVLGEFYQPFRESMERAMVHMEAARAEPSDYTCPQCGREMVYRLGKNGRFLACTGYPECRGTLNVDREGNPIEEIVAEKPCERCGRPMILRTGRTGPFLGCTGYPDCNFTLPCDEQGVPLKKVTADDIHETCEACGSAMAVRFARGKAFLGCSAYPKCKTAKPMPPGVYVEKPKPEDAGVGCDKCGRPMVVRKSRRGPFLSCSGFPRCRNAKPMEKLDELKALAAEGKIPPPPPENGGGNGRVGRNGRATRAKKGAKAATVDVSALGPPPPGFAWTRTGRPVVETWPEDAPHCPDCGRELALKSGRYGPYFGCTAYPKCSFVANLRGDAKKRAEVEMPAPARPKPIPTDIPCDECGQPMLIRVGRTGRFLGCSKYPKCKATKPLPEGALDAALATSEGSRDEGTKGRRQTSKRRNVKTSKPRRTGVETR